MFIGLSFDQNAVFLPKHYGVCNNQGQDYSVVVRPLLPHETLDENDYGYDSALEQFDLPFSCAK
jgi:hypothetical protein